MSTAVSLSLSKLPSLRFRHEDDCLTQPFSVPVTLALTFFLPRPSGKSSKNIDKEIHILKSVIIVHDTIEISSGIL